MTGLDREGRRDILAVEPMLQESDSTYGSLFDSLKKRGLKTPWLVISDANPGLIKAVCEHFTGCSWQRRWLNYLRQSGSEKAIFALRTGS